LGEELLTPTKIYVSAISELQKQVEVKGVAHITGGGFVENIPRLLPKAKGLMPRVKSGSWPVLPIFELVQAAGKIERSEMYGIFNMGVGMVAAVAERDADDAVRSLLSSGENAYVIGDVVMGEGIEIC
jgi:phosphoribosylformylglycinamidine cyclo-ligase